MAAVKQVMLIGSTNVETGHSNSIITQEAFAIDGEYDIDALGGVMSFQLPYLTADQKNVAYTAGVDLTKLKKFDTVKLYYGEFDRDFIVTAKSEQELIDLGFVKLFDGFVDTVKLSKSKENFNYTINALTTVGLTNYRTLEWRKKSDATVSSAVSDILKLSNLASSVPFKSKLTRELALNIDGGKIAKDFLMQIREKYAVILHQGPDGTLVLSTAEIFAQSASTVAWNFDFKKGNVFDLDYGDLTTNYNAVLVLGFPPSYGIALDVIGAQNNGGNVNYLAFENRDLQGGEACESVARSKLLELERNFSISFRTSLNPNFNVGQCFTMKDYDKYTGNERFLVKKFQFHIDKTDVCATLTGYTHSLTLLPQDIVLSPTGIADIEMLDLRKKVEDQIDWNRGLID